MSNDPQRQNQQQNQGPPRAVDARFEPIRVKKLEIHHDKVVSGLKSLQNRNVIAGQHPSFAYISTEIWFEPWPAMYRIRETDRTPRPEGTPVVTERCFHVSWASYEPAVVG